MVERAVKQKYEEAVEKAMSLKKKKTGSTDEREMEVDEVKIHFDENEDIEPSPEKDIFAPTFFVVKLASIGDRKVDLIKVVRAITTYGLKEAKDLVEAKPKPVTIKEFYSLEEAKAAAIMMTDVDAGVELVAYTFLESSYDPNKGEKTVFDVVLIGIGERKVDVIKAVREILV